MSTKKVKDGTIKKPVSTTRTKKSIESTTKEAPKTRTRSKITSKKNADDEEKKKKILRPSLSTTQTNKIQSRAAPVKKLSSNAKTPSSSRPATPPSNRVTKTQFFPSKKMYSNALKIDDKKVTSPKTKETDISPDSSISERPITATLRKGSIVNNNIAGPDVPKVKAARVLGSNVPKIKVPIADGPKIKEPVKVEETTTEYEDDFDSYESDFEEYDSSESTLTPSTSSESESVELKSSIKRVSSAGTDEEKKLDSGNYELPESRHRQILDNIKESIEKENSNIHSEERNNLGSLSDEGFEEGKSLQFINFLGAQKKYQHRKSVEMRRKRGEEILSMIRLDHYSFTLFELAPVPYDVFIRNFGKSNTIQSSTQTGEDDLDESMQTEEIVYENKWTQFPPVFDKIEESENFWKTYKCNYLGVGGDDTDKQKPENTFNENDLEKFLLSAGNLILNLQAEANIQIKAKTSNSNIPFSRGYILYDTQTHEILRNRPIKNICFCSSNCNKILTVHGTKNCDDFERSIVCIWSMSNVEAPEMFLVAFGEVTSCAFSLECPNLVFGGSHNGSVVLWDLKENSTNHINVCNEQMTDILLRSPTFSTEINYGHCCQIISIQSIANVETNLNLFSPHRATEVCSLDEEGNVIIWSVIFKEERRNKIVENQGLAHWGSVILTFNTKISLQKLYPEIDDFKCTDLALSHYDPSNLYVSTNYGIIIHCLTSGGKTSVKKFLPEIESQANCLEMCPFSSQYILAGFENGDISFYSRVIEKPLMVLSNKDSLEGGNKVQIIQWSHNRPLIFYTKDVANTIHIWNLKDSDMFPIYSVPFKEKIVCMKLSPIMNSAAPENTYMMIGTDNGLVYVHLLNEEHNQQTTEEMEKDKRKFFNYINRHV